MLGALERRVQVVEHVVVGDQPPLALAAADLRVDGVEELADQTEPAQGEVGGERGVGLDRARGRVERTGRWASCDPCW